MHIAHFSYEYPPSTTGGLGTYLEALVRHQRAAGHEVDVFFLADTPPPAGTLPLPFHRGGRLLSYGQADLHRPSGGAAHDIAVCHDWAGALVSEPLWRRGVPLVMTCHLPLSEDIGYYDDLPCAFAAEMEFFAVARADLVIAVSDATRRLLSEIYPFAAHKIEVVHNGTDTRFFCPAEAGEASQDRLVAFAGRFVEQKGFHLLPEIFQAIRRRVPDARLAVAGVGPLEEPFRDRVAQLGLADSVEMRGFLSLEGVRDLYREAAVVLMPSLHEPFGLVAVESMAAGTPVVASAVGGLREIFRDGAGGAAVPPGDVEGCAGATAALLGDPEARRAAGEAARRKVLGAFGERRCFEATTGLYTRLCRTPGAWLRR